MQRSTRIILFTALLLLGACGSQAATSNTHAADGPAATPDVYALEANSLTGGKVALADYRGKVTLFVNVASECGYTRQYAGLQALHDEFQDRGFAVLGFPCNQFGGQEPGSADAIRSFCTDKFGVTFPMFAKCEVKNGPDQSPVYRTLCDATGEQPNWNFCKYLVSKEGEVLGFYRSRTEPDAPELRAAIEAALQ